MSNLEARRLERDLAEARERNQVRLQAVRAVRAEKAYQEPSVKARRYEDNLAEYRLNKPRSQHITLADVIAIEKEQRLAKIKPRQCFICGTYSTATGKNLCRDHDHKTGLVRGILCHSCNVALGHFKDDIVRMERAIDYLRRFKEYIA